LETTVHWRLLEEVKTAHPNMTQAEKEVGMKKREKGKRVNGERRRALAAYRSQLTAH
jgi:hypothetical protein